MLKIISILLPVLLLPALLLLPEKGTTVFPVRGAHHYRNCRIDSYVDSCYTMSGSQGSITSASDPAVVFEYGAEPQDNILAIKQVAGVEFRFEDTIDVKRFKYLDLTVAMKVASACNVCIITGERFSDTANVSEQRYADTTIALEPRSGKYRLTLSKFDAPEWWKARIGRTRYLSLPHQKPDYSKVVAIRIQIVPVSPLSNPVLMKIEKIEFRKNRRIFVMCILGGCTAWLLCVAIVSYRRFRHKKKLAALTEPIVPAKLVNTVEDQKTRLITFIGANYQQPELTVGKVGKETGIRIDRIPGLLQEKYGMNFKQYLNFVRINEAKRLLDTTDENITQIAFAVGYNNIPNFNRVFKGMVGKNPTEFRDNNSRNKGQS